jgi:hypothetical protein
MTMSKYPEHDKLAAVATPTHAVRYFWRGEVCETAPMTEAEARSLACLFEKKREAGDFSFGEAGVIPVTHDHDWAVSPDDVYVCASPDCDAEYDPSTEADQPRLPQLLRRGGMTMTDETKITGAWQLVAQARESLRSAEIAVHQTAKRYEDLYASYDNGTYCIGRDAYWPADLSSALRDCEWATRYAEEARGTLTRLTATAQKAADQ